MIFMGFKYKKKTVYQNELNHLRQCFNQGESDIKKVLILCLTIVRSNVLMQKNIFLIGKVFITLYRIYKKCNR